MNKFRKLLFVALGLIALAPVASAEHLVILATNDTHSQIDPVTKNNMGGIYRLRAIFDTERKINDNVLCVHAGDAVQGTLFFNIFRGDVEYPLLDSLGYDIIILGNHEFDNGMEELAAHYKNVKATKLSTNYNLDATPLKDMFLPYTIKRFGDRRIGFFGINVNPVGLISAKNCEGLEYLPCEDVADATARYLKEVQKCDMAIMVSHIGAVPESHAGDEPTDETIAKSSHYIDMIIGGHSHTDILPGSEMNRVPNADGKIVIIGQNYKTGTYVGRYDIDLDNLSIEYARIPVDATWDSRADYPAMKAWLAPFRVDIDSLMTRCPIATSARYMQNNSVAASNWISDAVKDIVTDISGIKVDAAMMNVGGIRTDMPQGEVNEGVIASMFPFYNRFVVLEMNGADLIEGLQAMVNRNDFSCVSKELSATYDPKTMKIVDARFNGKKIDPKKMYKIATIDYLQTGGDGMTSFERAKCLYEDPRAYGDHVVKFVKNLGKQGKVIDASDQPRLRKK
ncbi:MAG: bifunctional metallophosphatase/5'-nucleotidase [Muribaculaceae bacterium]|nr:bifunctional metallophosphatase/5'-nucleotidase [Muribaculaceae bacterium]